MGWPGVVGPLDFNFTRDLDTAVVNQGNHASPQVWSEADCGLIISKSPVWSAPECVLTLGCSTEGPAVAVVLCTTYPTRLLSFLGTIVVGSREGGVSNLMHRLGPGSAARGRPEERTCLQKSPVKY